MTDRGLPSAGVKDNCGCLSRLRNHVIPIKFGKE